MAIAATYIRHNGKDYEPGAKIPGLGPDELERLEALGAITRAPEQEKPPEPELPAPEEPEQEPEEEPAEEPEANAKSDPPKKPKRKEK